MYVYNVIPNGNCNIPVYHSNKQHGGKFQIRHKVYKVNTTLKHTCLLSYIFRRLRQEDGLSSEVPGQSGNTARFSLKNTFIT